MKSQAQIIQGKPAQVKDIRLVGSVGPNLQGTCEGEKHETAGGALTGRAAVTVSNTTAIHPVVHETFH